MASKLDAFRAVYVDVDLTLINWPDDRPVLPTDTVEAMRAAGATVNQPLVDELSSWRVSSPDRELVVWSANGAAHARAAAKLAGIEDFTEACLTKPQVFVDDNPQWVAKRTWLSPSLF